MSPFLKLNPLVVYYELNIPQLNDKYIPDCKMQIVKNAPMLEKIILNFFLNLLDTFLNTSV